MKIAVVDNLAEGGAKRVVYEQLKGLSKKHEVWHGTNLVDSSFDFEGLGIESNKYLLEIKRYRGIRRPLQELGYLTSLREGYKKLVKDIEDFGADVILAHPDRYTQAPWVLRLSNIKTVYFAEEWYRELYEMDQHKIEEEGIKGYYERSRRLLVGRLDKYLVSGAKKIVTSSNYNAKNIRTAYGKKAEVVRLGVDTKKFKPIRRKGKPKYFIFVGEKDEIHGYPLVEKAKALSSNRLIVKVVNFRSGSFNYSDEELVKLIQAAAATLCLDKNEPFGLVALESMACGVPVIAVNEGGYKETIINGKTGLLIKRKAEKLYRAMMDLAIDSAKRADMVKQARRRALGFSWKRHNNQLMAILENFK